MRTSFDKQLIELNNELITMGALCEEAISCVAKSLTEADENLIKTVYETDRQIDRKQRDIESLCMKLLLHQQPVAGDLRMISAALRMISDMERIGDQASDIAEIAPYIAGKSVSTETHIAEMARAAIGMVTDSVESFVKKDITLAKKVIADDETVDRLFDKVKSELVSAVSHTADNAEELIDVLMIAKYFERIGDHAENIAEWVIYSVTGESKY